ncbi:putative extracellular nuclease [Allocatelliglobosispora scoriae]|uniref:Putative extracellular nuclease n=1 Tax=Allocatelliglobosispora scoriae TaxID=643052 RepID=A0A841BYQ1_9ACTN|nr:ExeM/NucH family extracellular endonuclease [Allocatelliglobosispora scoriae]MBB5872696.1 putative extracellular nuclease [Allocatelliglobosispora scoriae]
MIPAAATFGSLPAAAADFTPGNLVVLRVGDGSGALSSAATPVFLDEFTPSGTLVRSVPMPTATVGANRRLTLSGSATSEGTLTLSADGHFLTLGGYDTDPGTAAVAGTSTATVARVAGRVDASATVNTSTAITDTFSGNNIRGVVSDDGSRFWAVGANGGVRLAALGSTGASTQINSAAPTNIRAVGIAGGQLYASTGSAPTGVYAVGSGLPISGGQVPSLVTGVTSPYTFTALDRDPGVPGVDTLYVADDSGSPNGGIVKYSFDGTAWTARGNFRPGASGARGVTGSITGSTVTLYATTSATGTQLVKVEDTAAFNAPIAATGTVLLTAAANTALRGVAFAPSAATVAPSITAQPQDVTIPTGTTTTLSVTATGTGPLTYQWYAGSAGDTGNPIGGATSPSYTTPALTSTVSFWVRVTGPGGQVDSATATVTVSATPNTAPGISPAPVEDLAVTIGDPDNPPALRTVTVTDAESPIASLTVAVTSSNAAVATGGTTGTGATRTLTVNPVGVGKATLTVTVSDGDLTASTSFPVAVSAALPAGTHNHYGASDASTAVDLGDGAMIVADDETNVLRVYDRDHSRYPAATFDVRAAGLALRDANVTREIDIEAAARSGNTIYWVGSQGQNSSGNTRLNRQELFATTVTGTGTATTIALGGSYQHLRDDLIAWDTANGNVLGLAAAATRAPEGDGVGGPSGFNIEAAEFAPDGTTLLLGFRGPLATGGKAIVVPVTNIAALVAGNPTTGVTAAFGTPLSWDLAGKGVRELRRNAANQYVIIAGPTDAGTGAAGEFRFYSWDGDSAHQPVLRSGSLDTAAAPGKPESIVEVPNPLLNTSTVQVLTDSGDTVLYGDGVIAKEQPTVLRKSTSATVSVGSPPACTGAVATIGSVQGTGETSPVAGQTVTVRGTVVGDYEGASPALRGFYLQDAGDGDPATSDGIFVFDNGGNLVANGDVVEVTGPVSEFQGQTQLTTSPAGVSPCGTQAAVAPTNVTLPRATADDLERYESMLVRFDQTLIVTEHFQLGRFGQLVLSSGDRLRQPTADIRATDTAAVAAAQAANNLNKIILDDVNQAQNPDPIVFGRAGQPLSAANTVRGGDTIAAPVGVLTFTWAGNAASGNAYRLRPLGALGGTAVIDEGNPRPTAAPAVGTGGVKVAGANLLNFFNTYTGCKLGTQGGTTDCRGATSDVEYQRQLAKEVASLRFLDADVIGYMEIENDGYGSTSAVQALTDALNAVDGPGAWAFVNPDAATGIVDSAGTDAIRSGILYRTASVQPVAGATFADQNSIFERRPVAQTFQTASGAKFSLIANHFKSKGSCPTSGPDTDQGDGQSCWNVRRTAQATELVSWINGTVVPGSGDPDVLIVGDLNSYAGEDPIAVIEAAGYTNLVKAYHGQEAYSYVFDAQWGYLDYALSSSSLTAQITGAGDAHHNADEPSVLDYNTDFKTAGQIASLYAPDRFRTSDHDPVLVGIDLGVKPTITGTPPAGTVGEPYSFAFTVTGTGTTTVTLGSGSLPPGVTLSAAGALTGAPTSAGDYAFTVHAANAFGAADLAATIHIGAGVSATTVTASPNPVATGAALTLTATVTAAVAPTGSVTFADGATPIGTVALTGAGTAVLVTSALGNGTHTITAAYAGSSDLLPSTSGPLTVSVVDQGSLGALPDGTVGVAYHATVPFTGGGPVTFAVTAGSLPPGLSLSAAGVLSGTPTTGGGFTFTITATNPVGSVSKAYAVAIGKAATSTSVVASVNPSTVGGPVRFTATVTGPAGPKPTGTVQFAVDGAPLGGPVPLVNGAAVSSPISSLTVGSHQVTATYSGSASHLASAGSVTHLVRYAIKVITPTAGARYPGGAIVPVLFQVTDANGTPIPLVDAALLALSGRVKVSASGAQSLSPVPVIYEPLSRSFGTLWFTARRPAGAVTVSITITYPGAPAQVVSTPITLT